MAGVPGMRDKLFSSPVRAERFRSSIRVALIRNRLLKHILGEVEMSQTQIQAARILLDKAVPNVSSVELTGAGGGPIQHQDMTDLEAARLVYFAMEEAKRALKKAQEEPA